MKNKLLNKNKIAQLFYLFTFLVVAAFTAVGQQRNIAWTGATNSDWDTASNWSWTTVTGSAAYGPSTTTITFSSALPAGVATGNGIAGARIPASTTISSINGARTVITIKTLPLQP